MYLTLYTFPSMLFTSSSPEEGRYDWPISEGSEGRKWVKQATEMKEGKGKEKGKGKGACGVFPGRDFVSAKSFLEPNNHDFLCFSCFV